MSDSMTGWACGLGVGPAGGVLTSLRCVQDPSRSCWLRYARGMAGVVAAGRLCRRMSTKDVSRRVGALTFLEVMHEPANSSRQRGGEIEKKPRPPVLVVICRDLARSGPSIRLLAYRRDHIQIRRKPAAV